MAYIRTIMATRHKTEFEPQAADPADEQAIGRARAEVDAGKTVAYEKVRRWLESWGTDKELPRPRCK